MEINDRIKKLTIEMAELIGKTCTKPAEENEVANKRIQAIWKEFYSYGFYVSYTIDLNLLNPDKPRVEVTVRPPNDNLSPEDQKIYDKWFRQINGIKEDKEE